MARYIDADALIFKLKTQDYSAAPDTLEDWTPVDMTRAEIADIEQAPTADVVERKNGKWMWTGNTGDSRWMCSVCKCKENVPTIMGKPIVWDFCPNCGAQMDERRTDDA